MNERHQGRKRAGVIAAAGLTALIGTGVLASPASAHNPVWNPTCGNVSVDLTYYNAGVTNTVEVKAGGSDILPVTTFGSTFERTLSLPAHTAALQVEMIVRAGDDPDGSKGYSVDKTQTVQPCQTTPTPPPVTSAPPTAPASPSPSTSAAPTSSAPAAAPSPSTSAPGTGLAETGSSSATPIIAGVAAVVVLAGGGLVLVSRRRRAGTR